MEGNGREVVCNTARGPAQRIRRGVIWLVAGLLAAACASDPDEKSEEAQSCENGAACVLNDDCPGGFRCNGTACTKVLCLKNGERCDTRDVCTSMQCPFHQNEALQVCWSGPRKAGMECDASAPCAGALLCNDDSCTAPGSVASGQICSSDAACQAGLVCFGIGCVTPPPGATPRGTCEAPRAVGGECCRDAQCAGRYCVKSGTFGACG